MDAFILQLVASFLVGGFFVALITIIAERFGSKIGGLIGSLPSTSFVALLFIGVTSGIPAAVASAQVFPLALIGVSIFLGLFFVFSRNGFWFGLVIATGGWLVIAVLVKLLPPVSIWVSAAISLFIGLVVYLFIYYFFDTPSTVGKKIRYSLPQWFSRAVISGVFITLTVFVSKIFGPVIGGILAAYPVAMTLSLIIMKVKKKVEVARALSKSFLVAGPIIFISYGIFVFYFYPIAGLAWGTVIAYLLTALVSIPVYVFIRRKLR